MCKVTAFHTELSRAGWAVCEAINCVLSGDYCVAVWGGTPLSIGGELLGVFSVLACKKLNQLWVFYQLNVGMIEFISTFLLHTINVHDPALLELCNDVVHRAISAKVMTAPQSKPLRLGFTADETCEWLHFNYVILRS